MTTEVLTTIQFDPRWQRMAFLARYNVTHPFVMTIIKRLKEDRKTPYMCGYIGIEYDDYMILKPLDIPEVNFLAVPSDEIMVPWTLVNKLLVPIPTHYVGTFTDREGIKLSEFMRDVADLADRLFTICSETRNADSTKA